MAYVDGFVIPVPRDKLDAYKAMSMRMVDIYKESGALQYCECVGDDVKPGKWTSFPQSVDLKEGEVVVFSWIVFPDKATRDACNEKVMKDPRLEDMMDPAKLPFDGKRMIFGGFERVIDE